MLPVQVIDMWSNSQRIHPVSECPVLSRFPCSQRHNTVTSGVHLIMKIMKYFICVSLFLIF